MRRDVTILVIITLLFLTISGILGVAIHEMLESSGQYNYIPSSFGESLVQLALIINCFLNSADLIRIY